MVLMGMRRHFVTRMDMVMAAVVFPVVMVVPAGMVLMQTVVPVLMGVRMAMDMVMDEIAMHVFMTVYVTVLVGV